MGGEGGREVGGLGKKGFLLWGWVSGFLVDGFLGGGAYFLGMTSLVVQESILKLFRHSI